MEKKILKNWEKLIKRGMGDYGLTDCLSVVLLCQESGFIRNRYKDRLTETNQIISTHSFTYFFIMKKGVNAGGAEGGKGKGRRGGRRREKRGRIKEEQEDVKEKNKVKKRKRGRI